MLLWDQGVPLVARFSESCFVLSKVFIMRILSWVAPSQLSSSLSPLPFLWARVLAFFTRILSSPRVHPRSRGRANLGFWFWPSWFSTWTGGRGRAKALLSSLFSRCGHSTGTSLGPESRLSNWFQSLLALSTPFSPPSAPCPFSHSRWVTL